MAGAYVDTSALGRVLLGEPDAPAVLETLGGFSEHIASRLVRVELRRLALRTGVLEQADQLLSAIALIPVDEALLDAAETIAPSSVATVDAIHLVTALHLAAGGAVSALVTYDRQLAEGAAHHGLPVLAPTR